MHLWILWPKVTSCLITNVDPGNRDREFSSFDFLEVTLRYHRARGSSLLKQTADPAAASVGSNCHFLSAHCVPGTVLNFLCINQARELTLSLNCHAAVLTSPSSSYPTIPDCGEYLGHLWRMFFLYFISCTTASSPGRIPKWRWISW